MDANERQQILALLQQGRAALLKSLEGVSDEEATRIPADGKWSILGCVEHIAVSEDYLFSQIMAATPSAEPLTNELRETRMLERGTDRSRHVESPEEGHPKGRFPSIEAAVAHFLDSRRRTMEFVEGCQEDLRSKVTWHPILGDANNHEMLLSVGVHCLRHVKQIEETKSALP